MTGSGSDRILKRHAVALVVIVLALTLQFLVPALQLFRDGSQRWGWQMYSRPADPGAYVGVTASGVEFPISRARHFFLPRAEIRPSETLVAQLCERETAAVAIRVRYRFHDRIDEFPCGG